MGIVKFLELVILVILLYSCSIRKNISEVPFEMDCPPIGSQLSADITPTPDLNDDGSLVYNYSPSSLILAGTYGFKDDLEELETIKRLISSNKSDSLMMTLLLKQREINRILVIASLEVEAMLNYVNCNIIRLVRIKSELMGNNNETRSKLTNAGLILSVITAVSVTGIIVSGEENLQENNVAEWVGLTAALGTGFLAIQSERVDKKVDLIHSNNLVKEIWEGADTSKVFPITLWSLFNHDDIAFYKNGSLRDMVVDTWLNSQIILRNEKNMSYVPALINDRGVYTEEMLQLRIDLLLEIRYGIEEIARDLLLFNYELE